ncbi:YL1 nuclear protein-domain-containing protein [Cladochytrium replicatum]|nr:YL1 nuclear protein-domain-containing protein [Cladochytrium replicatum]
MGAASERSRRSNAGSRMKSLLAKAHELDADELFEEVEGDVEFEPQEEEDVVDSDFDAADDEEARGDGGDDEAAEEEMVRREEKMEKKRKRHQENILGKRREQQQRKSLSVPKLAPPPPGTSVADVTAIGLKRRRTVGEVPSDSSKNRSHRRDVYAIVSPVRKSSRTFAVANKRELEERLYQNQQRLAALPRKEKPVEIQLTQEELLEEAKETEKINLASLHQLRLLEEERKKVVKKPVQLPVGPIIRYHSFEERRSRLVVNLGPTSSKRKSSIDKTSSTQEIESPNSAGIQDSEKSVENGHEAFDGKGQPAGGSLSKDLDSTVPMNLVADGVNMELAESASTKNSSKVVDGGESNSTVAERISIEPMEIDPPESADGAAETTLGEKMGKAGNDLPHDNSSANDVISPEISRGERVSVKSIVGGKNAHGNADHHDPQELESDEEATSSSSRVDKGKSVEVADLTDPDRHDANHKSSPRRRRHVSFDVPIEENATHDDESSDPSGSKGSKFTLDKKRVARTHISFINWEEGTSPFDEWKRKPKHTEIVICPFTGLPAKYRDPKTGVPYANLDAYRTLKLVLDHAFVWSSLLKAYVHSFDTGMDGSLKYSPREWIESTWGYEEEEYLRRRKEGDEAFAKEKEMKEQAKKARQAAAAAAAANASGGPSATPAAAPGSGGTATSPAVVQGGANENTAASSSTIGSADVSARPGDVLRATSGTAGADASPSKDRAPSSIGTALTITAQAQPVVDANASTPTSKPKET